MKKPHLLRVEAGAAELSPLFAAARAEGLRIGWLELEAGVPEPVPPSLADAAERGALRAVAASAGRTVAVKPLRGAPVLDDLLREHFRGCALVLVRGGEIEMPSLERDAEGYRVVSATIARRFDAAKLAAALRKARPFAGPAEGSAEDSVEEAS